MCKCRGRLRRVERLGSCARTTPISPILYCRAELSRESSRTHLGAHSLRALRPPPEQPGTPHQSNRRLASAGCAGQRPCVKTLGEGLHRAASWTRAGAAASCACPGKGIQGIEPRPGSCPHHQPPSRSQQPAQAPEALHAALTSRRVQVHTRQAPAAASGNGAGCLMSLSWPASWLGQVGS
jgi:hypothetical protein